MKKEAKKPDASKADRNPRRKYAPRFLSNIMAMFDKLENTNFNKYGH